MTHLFTGDIHKQRIANWPDKYPWLPPEAFSYFTRRTQTLPAEVDSTLKLLASYYCATPERLEHAVSILKFKQDVLWSMMDALWHYFYAPECRVPLHPPSHPPSQSIVRILGSAAGGGFPQWNRNDAMNDASRHGCLAQRTQCSVALTSDGESWLLVHCSPDFRQQWNELLKTYPKAQLTDIILTDAQIDHIGGLLSLREASKIRIHCTKHVYDTLTQDTSYLDILSKYTKVNVVVLEHFTYHSITLTPHVLERRRPKYATDESEVWLSVSTTRCSTHHAYLSMRCLPSWPSC